MPSLCKSLPALQIFFFEASLALTAHEKRLASAGASGLSLLAMNPIIAPVLAGNVIGSSSNDFVVAEWRDPGGPPGPPRYVAPRHLHRRDDEAWYVLEGVLCVQVGDQVVEAHAGAAVFVPRGTPHTYWNSGSEPTRYLLVMTPRIYSLIQAIHSLTDRAPASLAALFQEFDSELLA